MRQPFAGSSSTSSWSGRNAPHDHAPQLGAERGRRAGANRRARDGVGGGDGVAATWEAAVNIDPLDRPAGDPPSAPAYHVDSDHCLLGWIGGDPPQWLGCDCEDPANPVAPRLATDGPRDCNCHLCSGRPRHERGREPCEYADHHCDMCHDAGLCTTFACIAGREAT